MTAGRPRARPARRTRSARPRPRVGPSTHAGDRLGGRQLHALGDPGRAASSAPRKMPGKASTLLIWFGKSLRPVPTTAACRRGDLRVHLRVGVGQGEDDRAGRHRRRRPPRGRCRRRRPTKTSAPRSASAIAAGDPARVRPRGELALVRRRGRSRPARRRRGCRRRRCRARPARRRIVAIATPAAPGAADHHPQRRQLAADAPARRCAGRRARRPPCRAGRRGRPAARAAPAAGARSRSSAARRCPRG